MEQANCAASPFNQLPSYLRPYNYPTTGYGYSFYKGFDSRATSVTPPLSSSPEDHDQPPSKRFAARAALPTYYPPPHLFRPVDFETPSATTNSLLSQAPRPRPQNANYLNLTPSNTSDEKESEESDSSRPSSAGAGGTQSIIGIDANYSDNGITASLMEADLWKSFNTVGNEMIVTKPGR